MFRKTPVKSVLFKRAPNRNCVWDFVVFAVFALSLLTLPLFFPTRVSTPAYAATSDNLNFQARLETASGAIVPDGLYDVEFKLYSVSSGGTALWTEARTGGNQVRSVNGYITVNLGSVTSFPANMPWDQQLWLTMNVNSDGEMSPRLKLTAVPYAFNAKTASQLATSSGSNLATLSIAAPVSGNQTFVLQDQGSAGTYNIVTDGNASSLLSGSFVQNQNVSVQSTSKFWISDAGRSDTGFLAPSFDTATAAALNIGTTNATTINLNQNTVIAANKNITYATGTGNFDQSASSGTFATGTGAVSLNGDTTVASGKNLTVTSGTTSLTGTTNLNTSGSAATNIGNASSTTTVTGTTNVNTSGSATTTIGNSSATNNIVGTTGITGSTSINTTGTASTTIGSATGGAVSIAANAASSFTTTTGALTLTSAAAATWGTNAGLMTLQGAGGTTVTSTAGTTSSNVSITTGNASAGASGNISIDTGTATTTAGTISIGTTNASAVTIGRPTTTTTIQGNTVVTLNATSGTNFVCQNASNQLSTCTNTPLTSGTGIQNQNTSVQLTSKFWISDAGRSDTGFLAPSFDTASAGTLSIGNANATTINVGTNATAHTINIGTGAAAQTIVIGSTSGASSLNLNSGAGGTVFNSSGGYSFQSGGTTTVSMDTSGVTLIKPTTNSTGALDVQNTTGNSIFRVDTTNQRAVASYMTAVYGTTTPTITFDTSASMINYTTPLGSNIPTRINIPNAVLNPYQQLIAIGLPSGSDATARAILVADARAGVHQPTIGVLSPDESNIFGFSWEGSNSTAYLKTLSGGIGLRSNTTDIATFQPTAINLNQNTTVTANLQIGSTTTDGTANILILDSYNSATEPTGYNGAMYYNTNLGKFRCYEAGAWKDCTASAAGYIQNQNASPQVANFWISGTARADTAIITPAIRATSDSTTAIQLQNAAGSAVLMNFDTANKRVGIGTTTPIATLHIVSPAEASTTGNGTNAVQAIRVVAANGGDTSGTTGQTGGLGGGIYFYAGNGGTAPAGSTNGWGGDIVLQAGQRGGGAGSSGLDGAVIVNPSRVGTFVVGANTYPLGLAMYTQGYSVFRAHSFYEGNVVAIQNALGTSLLAADTGNMTVNIQSGSDAATVGAELYSGNFSSGWTSTGWNVSVPTEAAHNSGNTNSLVNSSVAITTGNTYQVGFRLSGTCGGDADVISASIGGVTLASGLYGSGYCGSDYTYVATALSATGLTFTPSANWTGKVTNVSIKQITGQVKPALRINNASGTANIEIRSSGSASNVFIGLNSGMHNSTGISNTSLGTQALQSNTTGGSNSAFGWGALQSNVSGSNNTAIGAAALSSNNGSSNSAFGFRALISNISGVGNTGVGTVSLSENSTGSFNTAVGLDALGSNVTGSYNTALGYSAGSYDANATFYNLTNINNSTAIGAYAQVLQSNSIVLGSVDIATKVGIGTTNPQETFSVSPVSLNSSTITATQSGTTVTASSAIFSSANVGETFIWADGTTGTISAYTDSTHVILNIFSTRPTASYFRTHKPGFNVRYDGGAYVRANNSSAFSVQSSSGVSALNVDTASGIVQVGSANTDGTANLFILDSYNGATDPTGYNGAMYYNTSMNSFRCYSNGSWANCGTGGGGAGSRSMVKAVTTTNQTVATATYTNVNFASEEYDNDVMHDNVTNPERLTVKTAGTYAINGTICFDANTVGLRQSVLVLNGNVGAGTTLAITSLQAVTTGNWTCENVSTTRSLSVNDYVMIAAYQSSGGNLALVGGNSSLEMHRVDGGASITVGTLDGGTPSANGATINGTVLNLQSASASNPGLVNTVAQTFAGDKTFSGAVAIGPGSGQRISLSGGAGNHAIEIGRQDGTASTPFIDFHAGATATDFDSRIIALSGNGTVGGGEIRIQASQTSIMGAVNNAYPTSIRSLSVQNGAGSTQNVIGIVVGSYGERGTIRADSGGNLVMNSVGTGTTYLNWDSGTGGVIIGQNGSTNQNLTVNGTGTTCTIGSGTGATNCTSDARLKDAHGIATGNLAKIMQLQPTYFTWKDPAKNQDMHLGLIAQNVQSQFSDFVITDSNGYLALDYAALVTPLIGAVQEQQGQIGSMNSTISLLQSSSLATGGAINGSVNVTGNITVGGTITAANISASGNAVFSGSVTVGDLEATADITVGGHIVSKGTAPAVIVGSAAGLDSGGSSSPAGDGPILSINGTDTAGTITVTAGGQGATAGVMAHLDFYKDFTGSYKVVLTAGDDAAADLRVYVVKTAAGFDIFSKTALVAGTQYSFDYLVLGTQQL